MKIGNADTVAVQYQNNEVASRHDVRGALVEAVPATTSFSW